MSEWKKVASVSDISEDVGHFVDHGENGIAIVKVGEEFFAVDDMCSHAEASLCEGTVDGDEIECPLHFARFNVKTGAATAPPACEAIKTYKLRVVDGDIELEL